MTINEIKEVVYIRPNAKMWFLDEGTIISWVANCSAILINKKEDKLSKRYGEGIFTLSFTKNKVPIQKHTLKENQVVIIRSEKRDILFQVSKTKIGNPNPFMWPQDVEFFFSNKRNEESTQ